MKKHLAVLLTGVLSAGTLMGVSQAAHASDTPPSPLTKPGYTLSFDEEFNGTTLDSTKWMDYYLPHWTSNRENAKARYTISNGVLNERIDPDTPAWNPTYDSTVKVSSIQTYDADWWHRFNNTMPNDHHESFNGYTMKYGYIEMRAKLFNGGGGGHQALWLVGTGDKSSANGNSEIDMLETFFSAPGTWRQWGYGWSDPNFVSQWTGCVCQLPAGSGDTQNEFHTYGLDWSPTKLDFYFDGQLFKTINDAPNEAMGLILGIYTDAGSGVHNDVWPKNWQVDYLRTYSKDGGYPGVYERIKDRQNGKYLNIENRTGNLESSAVPATYWSSQWTEVPTTDGYTRLKNRWTGEFMNTAQNTGTVQVGTVSQTQPSADWSLNNLNGYKRIVNRQTGAAMNVEANNGLVQYSNIQDTAWSAQWAFDYVQN
ncbi:family 16 glycosylhydrolase [Arthrobacter sp. Y-9]|uniref:family 16 glycosylhydrolase n=1 Tax=Arthrobacter sp. Y-9 TaxID=3039385 RepID=UPI00241CDBF5|nr:family 16 glycosylhydrolase [Arthrobacter sp. Y-9]WFR83786.1 family 16 glycosylhydrolase [Arthrobacter sp. Y-9]